jgi:Sec-independent protein translocase protein TatA
MFALSRGEFVLVVFIFALVWGAGVLPRVGERLGARLAAKRGRERGHDRG